MGVPDFSQDLLDIFSTAVKGFSSYFGPYMIAVNHLGKIGNLTAYLEQQKYKSVTTAFRRKVI